jgi:hypothetical protein
MDAGHPRRVARTRGVPQRIHARRRDGARVRSLFQQGAHGLHGGQLTTGGNHQRRQVTLGGRPGISHRVCLSSRLDRGGGEQVRPQLGHIPGARGFVQRREAMQVMTGDDHRSQVFLVEGC